MTNSPGWAPQAGAALEAAARPAAPRSESPRTRDRSLPWSWKLVTLAGVDVYVHGTFLLLFGFIAFSGVVAGQGIASVLRGTALVAAVFTTIVFHELGHALVARRFGIRTRDITLLPFGGVARLERLPDRPIEQLLVAVAGPAVSFAIALLLLGVVLVAGGPVGIESLRGTTGAFLSQLMWINVSLAAFNLLPGFPMDGGRIVRALLAMRMAPERATQIAARLGQGVAVVLGLVGLFASPVLLIIAVFVWLGARAEHAASTVNAALSGLSVRQGMITDFRTVASSDPLSRAVELTLAGFQQDFPVMDGARLEGVLTHADLLAGMAHQSISVHQAMQPALATSTPIEGLDGALTRMRQAGSRLSMVVEDGELVGLLTVANIGELLDMKAAGRRAGARTPMNEGGREP